MNTVAISIVLPMGKLVQVALSQGRVTARSLIASGTLVRRYYADSVIDSHRIGGAFDAWRRACGGLFPHRHFSLICGKDITTPPFP